MEKRNLNNEQEVKKSTFEERKKRNPSKSSQVNQKRLPWWVELLFVQIGLPDKWLIKILKTKKNSLNFYNEKKRFIFLIFLFLSDLKSISKNTLYGSPATTIIGLILIYFRV